MYYFERSHMRGEEKYFYLDFVELAARRNVVVKKKFDCAVKQGFDLHLTERHHHNESRLSVSIRVTKFIRITFYLSGVWRMAICTWHYCALTLSTYCNESVTLHDIT